MSSIFEPNDPRKTVKGCMIAILFCIAFWVLVLILLQ
jgi:hypothetical protein